MVGTQTQRLLDSIRDKNLNKFEPAEFSFLLVYMQSAGMCAGLSINHEQAFPVKLPSEYLDVLVNLESSPSPIESKLLAHAFRRGFISVFPEVNF